MRGTAVAGPSIRLAAPQPLPPEGVRFNAVPAEPVIPFSDFALSFKPSQPRKAKKKAKPAKIQHAAVVEKARKVSAGYKPKLQLLQKTPSQKQLEQVKRKRRNSYQLIQDEQRRLMPVKPVDHKLAWGGNQQRVGKPAGRRLRSSMSQNCSGHRSSFMASKSDYRIKLTRCNEQLDEYQLVQSLRRGWQPRSAPRNQGCQTDSVYYEVGVLKKQPRFQIGEDFYFSDLYDEYKRFTEVDSIENSSEQELGREGLEAAARKIQLAWRRYRQRQKQKEQLLRTKILDNSRDQFRQFLLPPREQRSKIQFSFEEETNDEKKRRRKNEPMEEIREEPFEQISIIPSEDDKQRQKELNFSNVLPSLNNSLNLSNLLTHFDLGLQAIDLFARDFRQSQRVRLPEQLKLTRAQILVKMKQLVEALSNFQLQPQQEQSGALPCHRRLCPIEKMPDSQPWNHTLSRQAVLAQRREELKQFLAEYPNSRFPLFLSDSAQELKLRHGEREWKRQLQLKVEIAVRPSQSGLGQDSDLSEEVRDWASQWRQPWTPQRELAQIGEWAMAYLVDELVFDTLGLQ